MKTLYLPGFSHHLSGSRSKATANTLGLDVLRCQSPALIEREIRMQAIAYNLVRALMLEAALRRGGPLDQISFKGTVDTLRQWAPLFVALGPPQKRRPSGGLP